MRPPLLLVALPLLVSCAETHSTGVALGDIYAHVAVGASGSGVAEARVELRVGGALSDTFLVLDGDDALYVEALGERAAMSRVRGAMGTPFYQAGRLPDALDTEYVIAFERGAASGAPNSVIHMPEPLELTTSATSFSRASETLVVSWAPGTAGDALIWRVEGACVRSMGGPLPPDAAMLVLDSARIVVDDTSVSCDVEVTVIREREGTLDPAFAGGSAFGRQVRWTTVRSTP